MLSWHTSPDWYGRISNSHTPEYYEYIKEELVYVIKLIAQNQQQSGHGSGFGSYNHLSE
jgi:hypothetical protein